MKPSIESYLLKKQKELYAGLMLHLRSTKLSSASIINFFQSKKDGTKWKMETKISKVHDEQEKQTGV